MPLLPLNRETGPEMGDMAGHTGHEYQRVIVRLIDLGAGWFVEFLSVAKSLNAAGTRSEQTKIKIRRRILETCVELSEKAQSGRSDHLFYSQSPILELIHSS